MSNLTVTTLGGMAEHPQLKVEVAMVVPGEAKFSLQDETVLMLKKRNLHYQIIGMTQGKFDVVTLTWTPQNT